jgi:hypothetical protein
MYCRGGMFWSFILQNFILLYFSISLIILTHEISYLMVNSEFDSYRNSIEINQIIYKNQIFPLSPLEAILQLLM